MNERKTEQLVENRLRDKGYLDLGNNITVERQKSDSAKINKLLEHASKAGMGEGKPEFIIRSELFPSLIIVIECKADSSKHESKTREKYSEYAVDGVLLYASFLAKEYDVLAIAVSGETESELRISHFLNLHGESKSKDWKPSDDIVSFEEYYDEFIRSDQKFKQDYNKLLDYTRKLNNTLQAKKVTESQRGFLISGILIALQSSAFISSFKKHKTSKQLAGNLLSTIKEEFENAELPEVRRKELLHAFSFLEFNPALIEDHDFFLGLIQGIDENVNNFLRTHKYYDAIGHFYVEFLRYANNDKGLGIVLTPPHIAELFAELTEVNKDSIVFDNCCGTAGLLVSALHKMTRDAGADKKALKKIKKEQIFGVEFQPSVYALSVSNMILHGDGKTNILRGDCFKDADSVLGGVKPTIGLLNPPYKQKTVKEDHEELEFVLNNLEHLSKGGKCAAIVPITSATSPSGVIAELKKRILEKHTLEAVMSMPIELFHNSKTTVVTCVMVFTANAPHPVGKKTWFGYWRDDGFVKTKDKGRIDLNSTWEQIKAYWVNSYRNREVIDSFSVMKEVRAYDEWVAEAYLDADYSKITATVSEEYAKRYILSQLFPRGENN